MLADVLNRTLANLVIRCTKAEGTRDYFDVGVIGYNGRGVHNALQGALSGRIFNPLSAIEASPLRIDDRLKKVPDGVGGYNEESVKFPVWYDPQSFGTTPMREALAKAAEEVAAWCDAHANSYPPTILHITDGESTDGDPADIANDMQGIGTDDGDILLFNLHLSAAGAKPALFPDSGAGLPNAFAELLFNMSSVLPPHLVGAAREKRLPASDRSRGFIFNADAVDIVDFFDIGTRAPQMR